MPMIYIENKNIALIPYTHEDDADMYTCWQDHDTQRGYNCRFSLSYEEFSSTEISAFPFWCVILDKNVHTKLGVLRLGPDPKEPDLAIWIYPLFRGKGIGTNAFYLALDYIFSTLPYDTISAGCYEDNVVSLKMLHRLEFIHIPEEDISEKNCFTGEHTRQLVLKMTRSRWNQIKGGSSIDGNN